MTPMEKVGLLRAACCVAGIDQEISEAEQKVIDRLAGDVGVGRASLQAMMDRAVKDPDFHEEQFRVLKGDPQESMAVLLEVALADGGVEPAEVSVLRELSKKLNVPENVFDQLVQKIRKI